MADIFQNNIIKMVGMDTDGTVLTTNKKLSRVNKVAIEKSIRMGVDIMSSTGRSYFNIPKAIL